MKIDVAFAVGEALYPMLSGFQALGQQRLRAVRQIEADSCLDRIIFDFETLSLVVSAVPDDDTVDFEVCEIGKINDSEAVDVSDAPQWQDFGGAPFGWGWVAVNQQGYCDCLLLGFGGVFPQVVMNVAASSIRCGRIGKLS